jgi:GntR family transcriptional regulator / MocR family aminotransferase
MAKVDSFQDLALAPPPTGTDLWRWLYEGLRSAILDGRLRSGTKLPSSRNLATQYGVSRGTVAMAFDQLLLEGYTSSRVGSGTFVSSRTPPLQPRPTASPRRLSSATWKSLEAVEVLAAPKWPARAFRAFEPALDLFPTQLWARTAARVLRNAPKSIYGHGDAAGYAPLRRAIADYVGQSRGVRCSPEQVLVTSGTQQALDLISRLLLEPGDAVWMEDPGYPLARLALQNYGARIVPVPVDRDGLIVSVGKALAPRATLAYVTPANQFPLGVTMIAERRIALLDWAKKSNAWIIEDDYDAEYRYFGHPVASLQSVDRSGSVIYVGTFTKMLFNALRLGFLILPGNLVEPFERARSLVDRHPPTLDQAILAEFILEGHFGRHVRKMRQTYSERMLALKAAADKHLTGLLDVVPAAAGMKTIGWLPPRLSDTDIARRAAEKKLEVLPLSSFALQQRQQPALILGFAGIAEPELLRGVQCLSRVLSAAI